MDLIKSEIKIEFFTKHDYGDRIKEDEMGGTCRTQHLRVYHF